MQLQPESNLFQSRFNWLLSAGASHRWNEGLNFDQIAGGLVNTTTLGGGGSISANMTLFNGFNNLLNAQRNKYLYDAALKLILKAMYRLQLVLLPHF